MKKYSIGVLTILVLFSCSSSNSEQMEITPGKESSVNKFEASPLSPEDQKKADEEAAKRKAEYESTLTTLEFDKYSHHYGNVDVGSENTTVFTVTNTGTVPLEISNVKASCGCTTPKKPEKPIPPGESDVIEVTFVPKETQRGNDEKKTVVVTANTKENLHTLEISAKVNN